jgi:hypothetical protein
MRSAERSRYLDDLLEGDGEPVVTELCALFDEILGGPTAVSRFIGQRQLKRNVYRVAFELDGAQRSFIVKRLKPSPADRNRQLLDRWLPAVGLEAHAPRLLGTVAEREGRRLWQVYEDIAGHSLAVTGWRLEYLVPTVELLAQLHSRFAGHPLLAECRLLGGDLGMPFYTGSVRDAVSCLRAVLSDYPGLSLERGALIKRMLDRLSGMLSDLPVRARAMAEHGGPETLLHGDLWTTNVIVSGTAGGGRVRLIDWDRVGVGPVAYDLSTFLRRFPTDRRQSICELYGQATERAGWRLSIGEELNFAFDTAERARFANLAVWPALALAQGAGGGWAFERLASIEEWFDSMEPLVQPG